MNLNNILFTSLLFFTIKTSGQDLFFSNTAQPKIIYKNIHNRLFFLRKDVLCKDVKLVEVIKKENGDWTKTGTLTYTESLKEVKTENCITNYSFSENKSYVKFRMFNKKNGKLIGEYEYTVKSPEVEVTINGKYFNNRELSIAELQKYTGLVCIIYHIQEPTKIIVTQHKVKILRNSVEIYKDTVLGAMFSDAFREHLLTLKKDDKIVLYDIELEYKETGIRETFGKKIEVKINSEEKIDVYNQPFNSLDFIKIDTIHNINPLTMKSTYKVVGTLKSGKLVLVGM